MSNEKRIYIVFLGPPGSGKGTQARQLIDYLGLPQISTGDLFRFHLKNATELGQLARGYMDAGELVPDDVTIRMVEERLAQADASGGAIFDGFPRNLAQVTALEAMLAGLGGVSLAPALVAPDAEVMRRLGGRRVCRACGQVYHVEFSPPQQPGVCDRDGGELYQRDDDKPETIRNRLYVYYKQTSPLVGYYFAKGLLAEVDGAQSPAQVQQTLRALLAARGVTPALPTPFD